MSMPNRRNSFCTAANRGWVAASCAMAIMMPMFWLEHVPVAGDDSGEERVVIRGFGSSTLYRTACTMSCRKDSARAASRSSLSAKYR